MLGAQGEQDAVRMWMRGEEEDLGEDEEKEEEVEENNNEAHATARSLARWPANNKAVFQLQSGPSKDWPAGRTAGRRRVGRAAAFSALLFPQTRSSCPHRRHPIETFGRRFWHCQGGLSDSVRAASAHRASQENQ